MRALWIDLDTSFVESIRTGLNSRLEVLHFPDLDLDGLDRIDWTGVHLVIMELHGPRGCQMDLVSRMRSKKTPLPVLILTAHANKDDCILAINSGVNGLIEKPCSADLLIEKVTALLSLGEELPLNHERKAVYSNSSWVDLTSTEYRILECLKTARRRLTRAELQAAVWPSSSISENNLDTHLTNLKKKIPELNQYLNVKRGLGYFLTIRKPGS
jgi:DNA-binding response OmpR family regulator